MNPTIQLTPEQIARYNELLSYGLVAGLGTPKPGKMCIEAVWCNILGLPHGDDPGCVGSEVRKLKIGLNDKPWSSPQARAQGLRAFGLAQIGSDVLDQKKFRELFWFRCGTQLQPLIWRFLASAGNTQARLELANKMEQSKNLKECRAHAHAHANTNAYDFDYAYDYVYAYGYGYDYVYDYAYGYAYGYGYDYDYGYGYGYGPDAWFTKVADLAVACLKEMNSPGCQYLGL